MELTVGPHAAILRAMDSSVRLACLPLAVLGTLMACSTADAQSATPPEWRQHDMSRPKPAAVEPVAITLPAPVPADAVILFDGKDLSKWQSARGEAAAWTVGNGYIEVKPGTGPIRTREGYGDVQLHVEWASPSPPKGTGQDRGNSGIFLMSRYEVQVLDSYQADTYADGQAGAIYGQYPPLVNASRAPGEWQAFDIYFRRPRFAADGRVLTPARITVVQNGILVQDNEELRGGTSWLKTLPYAAHADKAPIELQDHGHPVRFRNIWVRDVPERPTPGPSYGSAIRPVTLTVAQLDRLVGVYNRGQGQAAAPITITRQGDGLAADFFYRPGPLALVPLSETEFALTETDARVVFDLDAQGRATALTFAIGGDEQHATKAR